MHPRSAAAVVVLCCVAPIAAEETAPTLLGFSESSSASQRELERRFDALIDPANLGEWMKQLTAHPHHVGSPWGKHNAEFIAERFRQWGYETEFAVYHVLFPTPLQRSLELLEPASYIARLRETAFEEDATSGQHDEQLPPYNAYSIDGDVTGELVYVNYGIPDDYEKLERRGIDVEGKIVIARYGASWRGIKPKVAAEHGAIGCILYSDPRDDGYFRGDVYPAGAFKPEHGVQRGSVADMPLFPGDPLTPGVGATEDAERLDRADAPTLTRIPVLPISYADAEPLLRALEGPVAPAEWRGALPLTYHLGPGPARVRLRVRFDWKLTPAYNVIARLPGSERPDQWIMRGNHHDGWVNGARDPISGLVALMEEARAIGMLVQEGWRPKRTILYGAWDAEEPGLLGSTEWAEHHGDELRERMAVYINTDGNSRGFLSAGGSHTLERFFDQVARDVIDPQKGISVARRARARRLVRGTPEEREDARNREDLRLSALGSGSDYTPFLQHLGIASLNVSYGGEGVGGEYHTIYDSFDHFTRFIDPGFRYGTTLARTTGRAVLRLADADLLPFDFAAFADTVSGYVDEISTLADEMRLETERENRLIEEKVYDAVADPTQTFVPPEPLDPVPHINMAPLRNAVTELSSHAAGFASARAAAAESVEPETLRRVDAILLRSERHLTRETGLPGRPWFRHQIYSPGFYTGYGVKTLPGVREAIEQRRWDEAEEQITIVSGVLRDFATQIEQATALLVDAVDRVEPAEEE